MDNEDPAPSYEESIRNANMAATGSDTSKQPPPRQSLSARLAEEQKKRVTALIQDYVDPLIDELPRSGLSRTVLILVPSDIENLQNDDEPSKADIIDSTILGANEEIIGFSDEEYLRLVRLHGQDNSSRFWQQPSVLRDLDAMIRQRLGIDAPGVEPSLSPSSSKSTPELPPRPGKKQLFRSLKSKAVGNVPMFNARAQVEEPGSVQAGAGDVQVQIAREEISVRSSTPVGLYETQSAHVLVIRMRIG